jgi:tRNA A-37 threonylcarbamoyl transferase component Bud32
LDRNQVDELCEQFESAWDASERPGIQAFLSRLGAADEAGVRRLLVELIKIDLYHRWRIATQTAHEVPLAATLPGEPEHGQAPGDSLPQPPRLEDYAAAFPILPPAESCPVDLIAAEYRARARWHQRPEHEEYRVRFGPRWAELSARLDELDRELGLSIETGSHMVDDTTGPSPVKSPGTTPLPAKIGRYQIVRLLGEGAFGRVYEGFDQDLVRPVAIKVPRAERLSDLADVEQYLQEARALASLDHPSVVPVYDVGRTADGLCYVVSKLIDGQDLAAYVGKQTLSFGQAAGLVATVADALQHVHHRGLVHRDIKPANILMDTHGKPSVADFGLALKDEDFGNSEDRPQGPALVRW